MIVLVLSVFQTNKKNEIKSVDTCPVATNYYGSLKKISAVQCANITCHSNSGTCERVYSDLAIVNRND